MFAFAGFSGKRHNRDLSGWDSLYRWSVEDTGAFWADVAAFCGISWQDPPKGPAFVPPPDGKMRGARWFSGAKLNFAQNMIPAPGLQEVIVSHAEGGRRRFLYAAELREQVAACQASLLAAGVRKGDRVCGILANTQEAIVAMLATASLGAVWASCSPDFGEQAVIDRFSQISPKVLFATSRYVYGGKAFDCRAKVRACASRLRGSQDVSSDVQAGGLVRLVWVDHLGTARRDAVDVAMADPSGGVKESFWEDWVNPGSDPHQPEALHFEPCAFGDPLYILFSSGTTGVPKCIVHSVGGTLLQHKKEILLHCDLGRAGVARFEAHHEPSSRLLFFTTCGWMMWNWMASALSCGAGIVLYDGSPVAPDASVLWEIVERERVTAFGLSPKYVASCKASGIHPGQSLGLKRLRWILSTGAPLLPDHYEWLYAEAGKELHVASISGGTDIVSCFMLGNPMLKVRVGEIQGPGLGMAIDCWDEGGNPVRGQRGELVCTKPFVSMPVGFWNDASGEKYAKAYFSHFDGGREVWRHGDFIEFTGNGGIIVHGRSDATLNPGGVRIGTAEIYRVVERIEGIVDSVAVGVDRGAGEEVVLLVKVAPGKEWNKSFEDSIRQVIRKELSPRHAPAVIARTVDIPYTRSGKKMEIAVAQTLRGEAVANLSSVANPESIEDVAAVRDVIFRK